MNAGSMEGLFWKKSLARNLNLRLSTCSEMMLLGLVSTCPSDALRRRVVSFLYVFERLWVCLRMAGSAVLISSMAMGQLVMSRYSLPPCFETNPMFDILLLYGFRKCGVSLDL